MLPALIAGGSALLGGVLGNVASAAQAQRSREFQVSQRATAHQAEVADLRAAGLNPILSGLGGSGAPTSAAAVAAQSDPIGPAVSTALEARRNEQELKNMEEQNALIFEQKQKTKAEIYESETRAEMNYRMVNKIDAETANVNSAREGIEWDNLFKNMSQYGKLSESQLDQLKADYYRRMIERGLGTAKQAKDLLSPFNWKIFKGKKKSPWAIPRDKTGKPLGTPVPYN